MKKRSFWVALISVTIIFPAQGQVEELERLYAKQDAKGLETFLMAGVVPCMDERSTNDTIEAGLNIYAAFIRHMRPEGLKENFWIGGDSIKIRVKDTLIGFDAKFTGPPPVLSEDGRVIPQPPPPPDWPFYANSSHFSKQYLVHRACFITQKLNRHPLWISADMKQAMELFLGTVLERQQGAFQVPIRTREEVQSRIAFLAKYMDIKTEGLGLYYSFYSSPIVWNIVISQDLKSAQLGYYGYFDGGIAALEKRDGHWRVLDVKRTFVE